MKAGRLPEDNPLEQEARAKLREPSPEARDKRLHPERYPSQGTTAESVPQAPIEPRQRPHTSRWT